MIGRSDISARGEGYSLQCLTLRAPPERGTFFRFQVYERAGILLVAKYDTEYGNLSFRSVKKPKRANRFCFLWNARLELLLNAPQPYNTKVTFRCIILHYNTLQMRYVTLHYTINFNTKVTIQKKICEPFYGCEKVEKTHKKQCIYSEAVKRDGKF